MNKFNLFKDKLDKYYKKININKELPSDDFLYWYLGFCEGKGIFKINKRKAFSFIIIQGIKNADLLLEIYDNLKLGHILKYGNRIKSLVIEKKIEIDLILNLFNGNFLLPSTKIKFENFFKAFYNKNQYFEKIIYLNKKNLPKLDNTWLLGYTEANGCFTNSILYNDIPSIKINYILTQKGVENLPMFSKIILLFNSGKIEGYSKNNYKFIISHLVDMQNIFNYFDKYINNFLSNMKIVYVKFKELYIMVINKDYLLLDKLDIIKKLSIEINTIHKKNL